MLVISNAFLIINLSMSPFIYDNRSRHCNTVYITGDTINYTFLDIELDNTYFESDFFFFERFKVSLLVLLF